MRLTVIDGFRGIFLAFMMIVHANDILDTVIGKLNHHYFGWVEDAQGFVFMSGLVVGLVYGGRHLHHGYHIMRKAIWARIRTIYSHQIFLIFLFLVAALIFAQLGHNPPNVLRPYESEPVLFPILSILLVAGSMHMGILPMYIFFMMVTPFSLRLLDQRRYMIYAAIIVACWALAQTQLTDQLVSAVEHILAKSGHRIGMGIFFNIFGWQVLFFGGLLIGFLMAAKRLKTDFLAGEEMRIVFYICIGLFFFFGVYDRIVFDDWFGAAFSETIKAETDRGNFTTIYPITFIVDLIIVVWLLGPGQSDRNSLIRGIAQALYRIVILRPFVFLGQHSLHVFSAHIVIVYVLAAIYQNGPPGEIIGTLIILLCLGLLYVTAWLHAKSVERYKASKSV